MNVNLSEDLQAYLREKVASGQYASVEEVIETALLELRNVETGELDARWLKAKIAVGTASLAVDGGMSLDEFQKKMQKFREHHLSQAKP